MVDVFSQAQSFFVDAGVKYDVLISKLEEAGYNKESTVSSVGDFSIRGSVVDFFSSSLPHPVRVDFSFDVANIYLFNLVSQITTKKIPSVSFVVSLGGLIKSPLRPLLDPLSVLSLSSSSLVWNKELHKRVDVSPCYYEDYRSFSWPLVVDSSLSSFGLFCGDTLFVPDSFCSKGEGVVPLGLSTVFDETQGFSVGDYLIHEDYGVGQLSNILSGDGGEDSLLQVAYLDATVSIHLSQINLISFFAKKETPGIKITSISKKGLWARKKESLSSKIDLFVRSLYCLLYTSDAADE